MVVFCLSACLVFLYVYGRYHQLRRFFLTGDSPDLPDHDFPITGMNKITPSGYMLLRHPTDNQHQRSSSAPPPGSRQQQPSSLRARSCSPVRDTTQARSVIEEDKRGRLHYRLGRTGPVHIFCRSSKFNASSSTKHAADLEHIAEAAKKDGKTVVAVIVDGGPDWSFKSIANMIAMGRCWRDSSLDGLLLVSFAPGQSKFNPIERQWAPRSRDLSGVELQASLPGEEQPPSSQTGLSQEERTTKQKQVHDIAVEDVCSFWNGKTYDGFPVTPHAKLCPSDDSEESVEGDLKNFSTLSTHQLREPASKKLLDEFRFLLHHCNRSRYLLSFVKCGSNNCEHCCAHPVKADQAIEELKLFGGRTPSPRPSATDAGHFATYLECLVKPSANPLPDTHRPSFQDATGRCTSSSYQYVFLSQADATRHQRYMHPNASSQSTTARLPASHVCRAIVNGAVCGKVFSTAYYLRKHRQESGHEVRRGRPV